MIRRRVLFSRAKMVLWVRFLAEPQTEFVLLAASNDRTRNPLSDVATFLGMLSRRIFRDHQRTGVRSLEYSTSR